MADNKKKIPKSVSDYLRVAFFVFYSFMLFYACYSVVKTIYNPALVGEYILGIAFSGTIMVVSALAAKNISVCSRKKEMLMVCFLFMLTLILRWMGITILKTVPISDFANCNYAIEAFHNSTKDTSALPFYQDYYAKYPAWFPYMRLLDAIYQMLCKGVVNAQVIKYVNAVWNALTCIGIYYAGRCFFRKDTAFMASMLYACSPTLIVWVNILSPDHILMGLFILQAITWYWMWRKKDNFRFAVVFIFLHAIICMLINWFKPLSILFLVVFICFLLGTYQKQDKGKSRLFCAVYVVSFVLCSIAGSKILTVWTENFIGRDVVGSTWTYLYAGSVMDEHGAWDSIKSNDKVIEIYAAYDRLEDQQQMFQKMAIEEVSKNKGKLPLLLLDKYYEAVNSEGASFFWANTNSQDGYAEKLDAVLGLPFYFAANGYYLLLLVLALCNGVFQLLPNFKQVHVFSIALTVTGFLCVLVLSVVQGRYKLVIMPYFVLLAACGMENIMDGCQKVCIQKEHRTK